MRWTKVCPLISAALLACASEETEYLGPEAANDGGSASGGSASGGSNASGGSSGSSAGGSSAAGSPSGGSNTAGSSGQGGVSGSGGTFNNAGNTSAGTFAAGGTSSAGAGGKGGAGGASGAGGKGGSGGAAGAGGKGGGGAGGTAGSGGAPPTQCTGVVIPAKSSWQGSALRATENDPPSRVFDGNDTTRFATGTPQMGDEWLQIDFGEIVTLNEIRLHTNNNDYFRHYQLRLSNTSQDFAATILNEADGMAGTITVPVTPAKAGRYLTIRQTGTVTPTWWSLHEVSVACK